MSKNTTIDRRTCLRGVGAALALPLLDSMGWAEASEKQAYKPPVRLVFMYMPHGVIMDQFWPTDAESFLTSPPPVLESLRPVLDQCLMMKGIAGVSNGPFKVRLTHLNSRRGSRHRCLIRTSGDEISISISADQIAAGALGAFTTLPSLELATMPQTWKENQAGLNEAYYSHCSFRSPTQAVPAEINPRNVLNRLFNKQEQGSGNPSDQSARPQHAGPGHRRCQGAATHLVADRPAKVGRVPGQCSLGGTTNCRHRTPSEGCGYREGGCPISRRIESNSPPIEIKIPEGDKRSEYMQVMCDLVVLAFQTDTTRVCTYIGSTPNGVSYPELGFTDKHHSTTHHNNEPEMVRKWPRSRHLTSSNLRTW